MRSISFRHNSAEQALAATTHMTLSRLTLVAGCLLFALRGWCGELVVMVDRAADMPMARFEDGGIERHTSLYPPGK